MPASVCAPSLRRSDGALPGNGGMCCEGVASGSRPRPTAFKGPSLLLDSAVVSAFFFFPPSQLPFHAEELAASEKFLAEAQKTCLLSQQRGELDRKHINADPKLIHLWPEQGDQQKGPQGYYVG